MVALRQVPRAPPRQRERDRSVGHSPRATSSPRAPSPRASPSCRYGQIIGFATSDIAPGEHVHTQNVEMRDFTRDYAFSTMATPTEHFDPPADVPGDRAEPMAASRRATTSAFSLR